MSAELFAYLATVRNSPQTVLQKLLLACSVASTDAQMSSYNEDSARRAPTSLNHAIACAEAWEALIATRSSDDADEQQLEWRRSGAENDLLEWRRQAAAEALATVARLVRADMLTHSEE